MLGECVKVRPIGSFRRRPRFLRSSDDDARVSLREQALVRRAAQRLELRRDVRDAAIAEILHALTPDDGERGVAHERDFRSERLPLPKLVLELYELDVDHVPIHAYRARS